MTDGELTVPSTQDWAKLGFHDVSEFASGEQSRVFSATSGVDSVAVKLTDSSLVDETELRQRIALVSALAVLDESVARPVSVDGSPIRSWGRWLVTATELIAGDAPDPANAEHAEIMGAALAKLHHTMRDLPLFELPAVAALRAIDSDTPQGSRQLLHGDFNTSNLRLTPHGLRVFDFDDCGYGPVEFDVANSLYMILFDTTVNKTSSIDYSAFRASFLSGYNNQVERAIDTDEIDSWIEVRVSALSHWLNNLAEAPIGIRTSAPEWLNVLRDFVDAWRSSQV